MLVHYLNFLYLAKGSSQFLAALWLVEPLWGSPMASRHWVSDDESSANHYSSPFMRIDLLGVKAVLYQEAVKLILNTSGPRSEWTIRGWVSSPRWLGPLGTLSTDFHGGAPVETGTCSPGGLWWWGMGQPFGSQPWGGGCGEGPIPPEGSRTAQRGWVPWGGAVLTGAFTPSLPSEGSEQHWWWWRPWSPWGPGHGLPWEAAQVVHRTHNASS